MRRFRLRTVLGIVVLLAMALALLVQRQRETALRSRLVLMARDLRDSRKAELDLLEEDYLRLRRAAGSKDDPGVQAAAARLQASAARYHESLDALRELHRR